MAGDDKSKRKKTDRPIFEHPDPVTLESMPLHPISGDKVDLHVKEIERKYPGPQCDPPDNVKSFINTWQSVSITEMVHWGTSHFQSINLNLGSGETDYHARCRKVWSTINDYEPKGILVDGRNRLTLKKQNNSDDQSTVTEVLGVCMGVFLAAKIFGVPLSAFSKRNFNAAVRHDFDIQLEKNTVELEVRGRFHKANSLEAIHQVDAKFDRTHHTEVVAGRKRIVGVVGSGDYSQRIGILAYPSDKPDRKFPDMEIMDPELDGRESEDGDRARRILQHYRNILVSQNLTRLISELDRLIALNNQALMAELTDGVPLFTDPRNYQPGRTVALFGRTRVRVGSEEFLGTYFDGAASPTWLDISQVRKGKGVFFWGISRSVFERLGSSRIYELLSSSTGSQIGTTDGGSVIVLLDDGVLTVWSPTIDNLKHDLKQLVPDGDGAEQ